VDSERQAKWRTGIGRLSWRPHHVQRSPPILLHHARALPRVILVAGACSRLNARLATLSGWQRIGVVISVLWLIASPTYLLVTKNEAANKSYAACIELSLVTGTRLRETGQHDEADAWQRHSNDWCLKDAGYLSPVGLARALLEGSYHSAVLWGFLLGPIALLWLIGSLVIGTVRRVGRGLRAIE